MKVRFVTNGLFSEFVYTLYFEYSYISHYYLKKLLCSIWTNKIFLLFFVIILNKKKK